jgi:hypothetical protein
MMRSVLLANLQVLARRSAKAGLGAIHVVLVLKQSNLD